MKGALYEKSTEVQSGGQEVILQPESQGLVNEQIGIQHVTNLALNSTDQVLYGYSVNGSRAYQSDRAKNGS